MREQSWELVEAGRIPEASVWSPVLFRPRFPISEFPGGEAAVKHTCELLPMLPTALLRRLVKDMKQSFQRLWEDCCFSELITSLERGRGNGLLQSPVPLMTWTEGSRGGRGSHVHESSAQA